ncbi:WD40/YVTN/BNR-like repeat-containing protein [Crossiella cryophila]|uniref:Photosystem II stability/assembly factor-like uncharacterized protein n=1 Tax=Crossiella cryophila TaxID=43355 RepID=A0A7W7FW76_9PSEU|nr:hypothetical protein [Crossiella cryophila]MBB4681231.1 photosystem II stability/assembly factor-like uncharacterized protein [Crossiella cryophila]
MTELDNRLDDQLAGLRADLRAAVRDPGQGPVLERVRRRAQRRRTAFGVSTVSVGVVASLGLLYGLLGAGQLAEPPAHSGGSAERSVTMLDYADPRHGYALRADCPGGQETCVNMLLSTVDGKDQAERAVPAEVAGYGRLPAVKVLGPGNLVINGNGGYWHSIDGGLTWRRREFNGPDAAEIPKGGFLENCAGDLAVECTKEFVTVHDPATGQRRTLSTQPALDIRTVFKAPAPDGTWWVAGTIPGTDRSALASSRDNGRSWQVRELPAVATGKQIGTPVAAPDGTYYLPVTNGENLVTILRSGDGGQTWTQAWVPRDSTAASRLPGPETLRGDLVPGAGGRLRLIDKEGVTWRSDNGGQSFAKAEQQIPGTEVEWTRNGFLAYSWTANHASRLYHQSGDGETWREVP